MDEAHLSFCQSDYAGSSSTPGDKKWAELQVLETLCSGIHVAMQNESLAVPILQNVFPLVKMPRLSEVELDKEISEEEYKKELRHLQKKLNALHYRLYRKKIPVVIAYEGWDAAGKGGNIKRIAGALDPRGYEVHPIASPEPHEKARHYLWRFWTRLLALLTLATDTLHCFAMSFMDTIL